MSSESNLFLIGVGYIGGTVLHKLAQPAIKTQLGVQTISVLTRHQDQADTLKSLGFIPILGDLDAVDAISQETERSSIVIHTASADHVPSATAVVEGLRRRASKGLSTIYLHTSGTGVLVDDANGRYASPKIFFDNDAVSIDALADTAPHRNVDLVVSSAARDLIKSSQRIAIILPPTIYGIGSGPFNQISMQVPTLINEGLDTTHVPVAGEGKAIWSDVHVEDLADAYFIILVHLLKEHPSDTWNPYFFASETHDHSPPHDPRQIQEGEHSWVSLSSHIALTLKQKGLVPTADIKLHREAVFGKRIIAFGTNSRSRAVRLHGLGWQAKAGQLEGRKTLLEGLGDEIDEIIRLRGK